MKLKHSSHLVLTPQMNVFILYQDSPLWFSLSTSKENYNDSLRAGKHINREQIICKRYASYFQNSQALTFDVMV